MLRRQSGIATARQPIFADPTPPLVIFIHGMWMPGHVAGAFRAPLEREFGFKVEVFHYRAAAERLEDVLERLQQRVVAHRPKVLHVVGHSLGGLLALNFFERYPRQVPGYVVTLGSPLSGSRAAQALNRWRFGRRMMGMAASSELLLRQSAPRWLHAERRLGVIAGTRPIGVGRLLASFVEPNDGTVALTETELAGMHERLVLPVTHFGMVRSRRVARIVGAFLRDGQFPAGRRSD